MPPAALYFLAHGNEDRQEAEARDKYGELLNKPHIKKFLGGGKVFEIASPSNLDIGYNGDFAVSGIGKQPYLFYGVWTDFTPKMLDVETPFGSVDKEDSWFKTRIGSYLGREPSWEECVNFFEQRWEFIKHLHGGGPGFVPPALVPQADNGC